MPKLVPSYIDKDHISSLVLSFEDLKENIFIKRFSYETQQESLLIISKQINENSFLSVTVDKGVSILDMNKDSFKKNDYYAYMLPSEGSAYSMDKWPNVMIGAYLVSRFVNKVGGIYGVPDSIRKNIAEFRNIISSLSNSDSSPLDSERAINYFSKGIASSLAKEKKKEKPTLSKAKIRRLRRHFHEGLLKKKEWSAQSKSVGIKLPVSCIQIKRVLDSYNKENEMRYSKTPLRRADVEQILKDLKYPAILVAHKNSDKKSLSEIPGYVLLDCSILPRHFAAPNIGEYILLIKRGTNIFDLGDSINSYWNYEIVRKQTNKTKRKIEPAEPVMNEKHNTVHQIAAVDDYDQEENDFEGYTTG